MKNTTTTTHSDRSPGQAPGPMPGRRRTWVHFTKRDGQEYSGWYYDDGLASLVGVTLDQWLHDQEVAYFSVLDTVHARRVHDADRDVVRSYE